MKSILKLHSAQLYAAIGLLIVFIIDLSVPLGFAIGVLYVPCILLISNQSKQAIIAFATFTLILILAKIILFYPEHYEVKVSDQMFFFNRIASVFAVIITTLLAVQHRNLFEKTNAEKEEHIRLIEETNSKLEAMQQAIDTQILSSITDTKGTIIYANKKLCEICKYSKDELLGQNHRIINSGYHPNEFFKQMWQTIASGNMWHGEIRNKAKDGTFYWVDSVILPVKNKNGKIFQYLSMRMEITDKKQMEETLLKEKQEMEHFTYVAAHDLKSPVVNMVILAKMLEEANGVNEQGKDLFEKIKTSVLQMQNTIAKLNEVIAFKKNIAEQSENLSLKVELNEVLSSIEQTIKNANAIINYDFSEVPQIYFPKIQLHSIFQNLITNSIKYRKPASAPVIDIQSKRNNGNVCLIVKDNGLGFDLSLCKDKIFGLFKRFHENIDGKGIGLYIVKSIVENNGGKIDVHSKVNEGTTFSICLKPISKN